MDKLLLRPAEFGEAIGVSRSKAYELIAAGIVPSVRIGTSVRVPVRALEDWIRQRIANQNNPEAA